MTRMILIPQRLSLTPSARTLRLITNASGMYRLLKDLILGHSDSSAESRTSSGFLLRYGRFYGDKPLHLEYLVTRFPKEAPAGKDNDNEDAVAIVKRCIRIRGYHSYTNTGMTGLLIYNHGTICMGDFNVRRPSFDDSQCNENGDEFRYFVNNRYMTVYDTDRKTHVARGRLDYVIGRDLVHVTSVGKFSVDMTNVVTDYYNTWVCPKKTLTNNSEPTLSREQKRVQELLNIYRQDNTRDNPIKFLRANKNLRELKTQIRHDHFEQFLQSINNNTSISEADMLLIQWAGASKLSSLPTNIQNHLNQSKVAWKFAIDIGSSDSDISDSAEISEWELNNALSKGKASAPGEDGITYSVLRLIAQGSTVFLDLKSAFDTANREGILEQLANFGIQDKLLSWIRMYLSNRSASVLFRGVRSSTSQPFELGTPQGGVLSPMLFNAFMHRLVTDIPLGDGEPIICYADDICVGASYERIQRILDELITRGQECGLVISAEKTMALNPGIIPLTTFHIRNQELDMCHKYKYLGVNVNDANLIASLKKRLWERLKPLKVFVGKGCDINVKLARLFYFGFIRSVVDYHALHLLQYEDSEINSLKIVQNEAVRIILGALRTARIVNLQLKIKPADEASQTHKRSLIHKIYILQNLSVKCQKVDPFPHGKIHHW
nr:uncharacterized protein LOC113812168 [Penaeus vannamei]